MLTSDARIRFRYRTALAVYAADVAPPGEPGRTLGEPEGATRPEPQSQDCCYLVEVATESGVHRNPSLLHRSGGECSPARVLVTPPYLLQV